MSMVNLLFEENGIEYEEKKEIFAMVHCTNLGYISNRKRTT